MNSNPTPREALGLSCWLCVVGCDRTCRRTTQLSDPAHEGVGLQPGRDGRVRCSAWLGLFVVGKSIECRDNQPAQTSDVVTTNLETVSHRVKGRHFCFHVVFVIRLQ